MSTEDRPGTPLRAFSLRVMRPRLYYFRLMNVEMTLFYHNGLGVMVGNEVEGVNEVHFLS
jgi:hypothetical protein